MDENGQLLIDIGLTTTEAKIYLAGLNEPGMTIERIGQQTAIKRPTIYHAIGTLKEKGLVAEKRSGNKTVFTMSSPEHLHGILEEQRERIAAREKKLKSLIPLLSKHQSAKKDDASVVHYHGIEGMKLVMDIAFYCRSKHWDIVAPIENFLREYDKAYADRYVRARKHYGITSRALWENRMHGGKPLSSEERRERNPRYMPKSMQGKFKSMLILFDDKVAIFSSFKELSAILITSHELHGMFDAMFEGLWEISQPY